MSDDPEDKPKDDFEERFNKLFHKAMGAREKRTEEKLTKSLTETLGKQMSDQLTASMTELKTMLEVDNDSPSKKEKGGLPPEVEAALRQATKDASEAKDLAKKYKNDADAERTRSDRSEERSQLMSSLSGKVKPALLEMTVDNLHSRHVVRDPESRKIFWKNNEDELVPFDAGVSEWTKSDVAKELAPPRDVGGGGGRGPKNGPVSSTGPLSLADVGAIVAGSIPR